jgi:quercetin dioxygenase-like cupin family protein
MTNSVTSAIQYLRWDDIPMEEVSETLSRKIVTGEREMVTQIFMKQGCFVPTHSHESEQITLVIKGALKFRLGGREFVLRPGDLLCIPSWMEHSAEALEETFEMDIFSPIRQDWLDKTDAYLRRGPAATASEG